MVHRDGSSQEPSHVMEGGQCGHRSGLPVPSKQLFYVFNPLDIFGEILFLKRDMGLEDKAQKHCTLHGGRA